MKSWRPIVHWPTVTGLVMLAVVAAAQPAAAACGDGYALRADLDGMLVAFSTRPALLRVGQHFELEGVVCGGTTPPSSLRIDADMPAHRHGMNYRASTTLQPDGRFTSRGLLFHMPGRWRFIFDLATVQGVQRAVREVSIE